MRLPTPVRPLLCFGAYELDTESGTLYKYGTRIRLQEQPFKILALLLQRHGRLVTREEIRKLLWPDTTVDDFDHGLNNAMNRLREALCDTAQEPHYIETIPKHGYRFIAAVEGPDSEALLIPPVAVIAPAERETENMPSVVSRPRRWLVVAAMLVVAVLIAAGMVGFRQWRTSSPARPASPRAIAILPFENLTGDPGQEYFADGMTDELTTEMAQIGSLRVTSRTSAMQYKGKRKALAEIARDLKVDAVVEGSVVRSGNRVRVTAQLIDSATDQHVWAQSYERDLPDIVTLQAEIARAIVVQIQASLTPTESARLAQARPVDPEAYQLYLLGRFYLAQRSEASMSKAAGYLEKATTKDPGYAPAFAALAVAYASHDSGTFRIRPPREVLTLARAAAQRALELDPRLPDAYTVLASTAEELDWDLTASERYYRQALAVGAGSATAHYWYAKLLSGTGRGNEALAEMERAWELDPLSLVLNNDLGGLYLGVGRTDQGFAQLHKTLDMDPNYPRTHMSLGIAYEGQGRTDAAVREYQKARALGGENWPELWASLQRAYEAGGVRGYYQEQFRLLVAMSRKRYVSPVYLASVALDLGDKEEALAWFEKAFQERDPGMLGLKYGDFDARVRSDPRYQNLLRRVRATIK